MNKKNSQAIVLRAGLTLSMLFGVGFQAKQVLAAEQLEDSVQENLVTEVENPSDDGTEEDIVQELEVEIEPDSETVLEEPEKHLENYSEEGSVEVHKIEQSEDKEIEATSPTDEELMAEEREDILEGNAQSADETTSEKEVVDRKEDDSFELDSIPEAMTMSAKIGHPDDSVTVDRVHGQNRFKNAVEISKKGWSTAPKVFIANGYQFADSLTGSPLAALNNAPILLTRDNFLPEETLEELIRLKTKEVVILGGELSVPKHIVSTLEKNGFKVTRIGGNNRYTQAELVANEIMKVEGKNRNAFLASGEVFPDALSIATVASNKRLPIFLTRRNRLEQAVKNAIPNVNSWMIIGGKLTITETVENEMKKSGAKVDRIDGRNRYEVNRNVLNYYGVPKEHLYVTSGEHYSDTLPASVLASKENSGILLFRNNRKNTNDEQKLFAQNKHKIRDYTIVGGPLTLSKETEEDLGELIRTVDDNMLESIKRQFHEYTFSHYDITFKDALDMQMQVNPQTDMKYTAFVSKDFINALTNTVNTDVINVYSGAGIENHIITQLKKGSKVAILNETNNWYKIDLKQTWVNAKQDDVNYYLNPNNFIFSDKQKFQFLDLSRTSNATAGELNIFLKGKGILEGMGQAFIDAGNMHGINEIYLLSHALLETGHGTSNLATGIQVNGNKVYNMYGVGAFDDNPEIYGSLRAYEEKWFTPKEAIIGGAAFIGNNYIKSGQNTLYKMRWNPESMDSHGYASHQYATDIGWSSKQVDTMYNLYKSIGIDLGYVDIPVYLA